MSQAARVSGEFAQETFERWKEIGTGKTFQGARFERRPCGAQRFYFRRFEQMPFDSIVIVAPRHSKYFDDVLAELTDLRARGLAE